MGPALATELAAAPSANCKTKKPRRIAGASLLAK
jgi:hypothetical protein